MWNNHKKKERKENMEEKSIKDERQEEKGNVEKSMEREKAYRFLANEVYERLMFDYYEKNHHDVFENYMSSMAILTNKSAETGFEMLCNILKDNDEEDILMTIKHFISRKDDDVNMFMAEFYTVAIVKKYGEEMPTYEGILEELEYESICDNDCSECTICKNMMKCLSCERDKCCRLDEEGD